MLLNPFKALSNRQRALLGAVLFVGSIALVIWIPNPLTFLVVLVGGMYGMWMLMDALAR